MAIGALAAKETKTKASLTKPAEMPSTKVTKMMWR
jgi:hypothetical protein